MVFPKTENPQAWLDEPLRNLKDAIRKQMLACRCGLPPHSARMIR